MAYTFSPSEKSNSNAGGTGYVIATLPNDVVVDHHHAEVIGVDYLRILVAQIPYSGDNNWLETFRAYESEDMLIFRTIMVTGTEYIDHLRRVSDWEGNRISEGQLKGLEYIRANEKFWLVELSVPELFSANRRKTAEVLIRAEIPADSKRDFANFLLARLPGYFAIPSGGGPDGPTFNFFPNSIKGHVELRECEEDGGQPST